MTSVRIYHNPSCSKSRETLALLRARGVEPEVVQYLKTPPSAAELEALAGKLGGSPQQLLRTHEAEYGLFPRHHERSPCKLRGSLGRAQRVSTEGFFSPREVIFPMPDTERCTCGLP